MDAGVAARPAPRINSPYPHQQVLSFLAGVRRPRVLDVGAGEGALALALVEAGYDVTACDVDLDHRDLGQRLGPVAPGTGLGHVNPIPVRELCWLGQAYGLPREAVGADCAPRGMRALWGLTALLSLHARLAPPRSRRRCQLDLANSHPVLCGYRLVLSFVKASSARQARLLRARPAAPGDTPP